MGDAAVIPFPRLGAVAEFVPDRPADSPARPAERSAVWRPAIILTGAWLAMIGATAILDLPEPAVRFAALFVHLLSLTVGFGAVAVMDAYGVLWLLGRRSAAEVVRLTAPGHILICLGLAGLLTSGVALHPDLGSPLARIKLVLVLVVMLNGLNAHRFTRCLERVPAASGENIPLAFVPCALVTGIVSQIGWWGAIVIGFLTTSARGG